MNCECSVVKYSLVEIRCSTMVPYNTQTFATAVQTLQMKLLHPSQYSTVVLTVVRVMIAKYRKSGIWGYRSSLTPEPVELK